MMLSRFFNKKKNETHVDCKILFARYMMVASKKRTPIPDGFRAISLHDATIMYPRMMWLNANTTFGFNIDLESSDTNIWISPDKALIIKKGVRVWTFDGLTWIDEVQALKNQR
jgi:hypothetical protein